MVAIYCPQETATSAKMAADLERLKLDRGDGDPVPLVRGGGVKEVPSTRSVEIRLDQGESSEDSDDVPVQMDDGEIMIYILVFEHVIVM